MVNSNVNLIQNWNADGEALMPNNNSKVISNWDDDDAEANGDTNFSTSNWGNTGSNAMDKPKINKFGEDKQERPRPTGCFNCHQEGH